MKIAVVEKNPSKIPYSKYFNFEYDQFALTDANKSRLLKADITLDLEMLNEYDFVILVGSEPCKHVAKVGSVLKYAGYLVDEKYIPIMNPSIVHFKPETKPVFDKALRDLHANIEGTYGKKTGEYIGIQDKVTTLKYLDEILNSNLKYVAIDTEGTGLYPRDGYVLGIGLAWKQYHGIYIDTNVIDEEVESKLQQIFNKHEMVFHNAKYDIKMLSYHFEFKFPIYHCTMLQHYTLNENEEHGLKYLALKYTKLGDYDKELDDWKRAYCRREGVTLKDFTYDLFPFEIISQYGAADPDATLQLFNKFYPIIQKSPKLKKVYEHIQLPADEFLREIEDGGVPFDNEELKVAQEQIYAQIYEAEQKLYDYPEVHKLEKRTGNLFNPGSPKQLQILFYEMLNLPVTKLTPKGSPSTDKEVLENLKDEHEIVSYIHTIRTLSKIKSTYIDKIRDNLDHDSRLRTNFNQHVATSGRLSSSGKLNLQQFPRDNKIVKHCIKPVKNGAVNIEDYVIVSQDLKTAEMYYASVLSNDRHLQDVFKRGEDFHSSIAKATFGLTCEIDEVAQLYENLRQGSKALSFGILYGAGPKKVAESAGISMREAKDMITQYFSRFSGLKNWLDSVNEQIENNGFIYSHFGRKRRVKNVFSSDRGVVGHAIRSATNFLVQSVASDANLLAAIDTHNWLKENQEIDAKIFMLVHDSIVAQVHKKDVDVYLKKLAYFTQLDRGCSIKGCPIGLDIQIGTSYAFKD